MRGPSIQRSRFTSLPNHVAIATAKKLQKYIAPHLGHVQAMQDLQHFQSNYLWVLLRFWRWNEILAEAEPTENLPYVRTLWRNARAVAFMRLGDLANAEAEIKKLDLAASDPALEKIMIMGLNKGSEIVAIGVEEAKGELAAARGDYKSAIEHLQKAIAKQDSLVYIKPPSWF